MNKEKITQLKEEFNRSCWISPNQHHFYCKDVDRAVDLLENEIKEQNDWKVIQKEIPEEEVQVIVKFVIFGETRYEVTEFINGKCISDFPVTHWKHIELPEF